MKRFFLLDFYNYCLESDDFILTDKCVYLRIGNLKIEFENPFIDVPCFAGCKKSEYGFIDWHTFYCLFMDNYKLLLPYEKDEVHYKIMNRSIRELNYATINFILTIDKLIYDIGYDYDANFRYYIYRRIFRYYENSHNRYFYKLMKNIDFVNVLKIPEYIVKQFIINYYDFKHECDHLYFNDEVVENEFHNKLKFFFNKYYLGIDTDFIEFDYKGFRFRTYSEYFDLNEKVNNKPVFRDNDLDLLFGSLLNVIAFYFYDNYL